MDASLLKRQVITDFNSFIEMKARASTDQKNTLNQAAKQFEAIFLQKMMKSMRQANDFLSDDSPLKSKQMHQFEEMLDQQQSLEISNQAGGIGLAEMMIKQLDKSNLEFQFKNRDTGFNGIKLPVDNILSEVANRKMMIATPKDFVKAIWPAAKNFAKELGVDPKVLIAQAAHETGWGKHIIKDNNDQSSYNLFNIKGGGSWQKGQANVLTTEYIDGKPVKVNEPFRQYQSISESFQDYVSLIKNNQRYQNAILNSNSPDKYMAALQQAGYATDPSYANKVMAIYHGDSLANYLEEVEK